MLRGLRPLKPPFLWVALPPTPPKGAAPLDPACFRIEDPSPTDYCQFFFKVNKFSGKM